MEAVDLPISQRLINEALSIPSTRRDDLVAKVGKEPDETAFYLILALCRVYALEEDQRDQAFTELAVVTEKASEKAIRKVIEAGKLPIMQMAIKRRPDHAKSMKLASMVAYFELQRRLELIHGWEIFQVQNDLQVRERTV